MRDMVKQSSKTHQDRAAPARKHRWLRWAAAGLATVVVLAFVGTFVFIHFLAGPVPVPLALPKLTAAAAGTGSAPVSGPGRRGKGRWPGTGPGGRSSHRGTPWPAGPAR